MLQRKFRTKLGFTLAEVLIVVVITIILAGVAFVAVPIYQRSLEQLEYDGIAKEIFVAAQNHLTLAESQGYLGMSEAAGDFGTAEDADKGIYYFVVEDGSPLSNNVLSLMLPDFSIDETVRLGGSYIVRYQKSPAQVLDVFYSDIKDTRFGYDFASATYSAIFPDYSDRDGSQKAARRSYGDGKKVIGYYGGVDALMAVQLADIEVPMLNVYNSINEDRLLVTVNVPTYTENTGVRLIITGVTSGKSRVISLCEDNAIPANSYQNVLDAITESGMHFKKLFCSGDASAFKGWDPVTRSLGTGAQTEYDLIPGEDIIIRAEVYRGNAVAYGNEMRTNSLFASLSEDGETVTLTSMRHLANLGYNISAFDSYSTMRALSLTPAPLEVKKAVLMNDLSWKEFSEAVGQGTGTAKIYYNDSATDGGAGLFVPMYPNGELSFDGQGHSITGLTIDASGNAGLFSSISGGTLENLELIDISVTATGGNAGTFAGSAAGSTINNVLVHGSGSVTATANGDGTGNAGGLIGALSASGSVNRSASVVTVNGAVNAGGLIGSAASSNVAASYAGGHTKDGSYSEWIKDGNPYDVTSASGNAGGLIGSLSGGSVTHSYSTCSASGTTAGGLAGSLTTGAGNSVSNSYATGLLNGTTKGAFAGSFSGTASGCYYFEAVNETAADNAPYNYLGATSAGAIAGVSALDATADSYNTFCGSAWSPAQAFDSTLGVYYQGKYNLKTVKQLGASVGTSDFVAVHYGDWPAPEVFVINKSN